MNLAAALKPFFRPPDLRPERQIESELDEEFAFHIEQIERELYECDPAITHEEASRRARARFGDIETLKKRCKRIAMEERIMLQKINAVLMVVVLIAIGIVSMQVWSSNRATLHTLALINAQIEQMQAGAAVEPQRARPAAATPAGASRVQVVPLRHGNAEELQSALRVVYDYTRGVAITADSVTNSLIISAPSSLHQDILDTIAELDRPAGDPRQPAATTLRVLVEGTVERPGWYPITMDGATYLHEVVREAGPLDAAHYVLRFREGADRRAQLDSETGIFRGSHRIDDLLADPSQRIVLRPDDELLVYEPQPRQGSVGPAAPPAGIWREVDRSGELVADGATIDILSTGHIQNLREAPGGVLKLPRHGVQFDLTFMHRGVGPQNLQMQAIDPEGTLTPAGRGRWMLDRDGQLQLNVHLDEPITLVREGPLASQQ